MKCDFQVLESGVGLYYDHVHSTCRYIQISYKYTME